MLALIEAIIPNDLSTPVLGVPLTVLGTGAGGAFASYAYGSPEKSRAKLFMTVIANTFLAAAGVAVIPKFFGWTWVTPVVQPPLAGLLAFFARWAIPMSIELAPGWLKERIEGHQ